MKKLLGISLVAVLAATPLMAGAAVTDAAPTSFASNAEATDINAATASTTPKYQLMGAGNNDGNAASAGYVKGAYNAAIKAVNAVHDEVTTISSNALTTAGNGLSKDGNTVSIDLIDSNSGLAVDSNGLAVDAGNGIELNSDGVNVKAKTAGGITVDSNGVSVNAKSNGGITVDANGVSVTVDSSTINVDSTTGELKVGTIGKSNIAAADIVNGTDTYATDTDLVTQGYVDQKVAVQTTGMAKTAGVEATIKNTTLSQGAVTQGLNGTVGSTTSTIANIMTNWGDDTTMTAVQAVTAVDNGTLATNVSVAAPTINAASVSYSETVNSGTSTGTGE